MSNTYPDGAPQTPYGDPNNAAGAEGAPEPQPTQAFPPVPVVPLPGQGAGVPTGAPAAPYGQGGAPYGGAPTAAYGESLAGPQGGAEPYGYQAAPYGQEPGAYGQSGAGSAYNQGGAPYGQQPEPGPNPFIQPDGGTPYGGEAPTAAYGEPLAGGAPGGYGQPAAPYGGEQPTAAYGQPYGANQYGDPQYGNQPPAIAPQGYGNPYQQEPPKKKSRGPLIAGITAGVVAVIAIIVVVVLFATGVIGGKKDSSADAKPNTSTSQTQGDSKSNGDSSSNGNSDGSGSNDLNNLDDALQNGADDTNNDLNNDSFNGSSSSGKPSLEEFVNSSEIQSQLDSMTSSYQGMGISIKAYAEGNTLVYDYTLSDTYSSMGDMMTSSLDGMDSTFKSVAQTLNETCDTGGNAKVRVYLHTESGKTLFDKSYTE